MKLYSISGVLFILLCTWRTACGNLDLLLAGYNDIPSDDSAVIAIPDIGTHAEGRALICRHNIDGIPPSSNPFDNWNYITEDGQEVTVNSTIGWTVSRGQSFGVVRLERIAGVSPLEGTYKCSVERRDRSPVVTETVSVNLYWPITDIEVSIEVVSQESQEYNVTCMAVGGKVDGSSLTGPAGENLGQLHSVMDQEDLRGANNYFISLMRTGATHGNVFTCRANNRISNLTAYGVLSVAGSAVNITAVQVSSLSPTLTVSWNAPQDGATVTSFTVHYTSIGSGIGHGGSIHSFQNMSISIPNLMADGGYYNIVVEAHSVHFSGISDPLQFKPCLVSQLLLESKTVNSLSLIWDRPSYYTSSITGLIQYRALPDGDRMWLYIEENDGTLPVLRGLAELTPYSIQMAIIDSSNKMCVFSKATVEVTGLGAVRSLQVQVMDDSIEITWFPPNAPVNTNIHYTVTYVSLTTANDESTSRVTVTRENLYLRISAIQGEMYEITVIPYSTTDTGDSTTVIARVDYAPFQLRIDGIGTCKDWIDDNTASKLSDISSQIEEVLSDDCSCEPEIQKSEFVCRNEEHDFVIFRGQLFSPANSLAKDTSSDKLLSVLDEWITRGSSITIGNENSINSNCIASQSNTDDSSCIMPGEATTTGVGAVQTQSSVDTPLGILVGLGTGCFIVGVMTMVVGTLTVYIVRKHCKQKSYDNLRNRLRDIDSHQQKNPRYDEALPPTIIPAYLSQRDPQSELRNCNLTITNLSARKEGACGSDVVEMDRLTNDGHQTAPQAAKVANPLYEFVDGPKCEPQKEQQAAVYTYIQVNPKQ